MTGRIAKLACVAALLLPALAYGAIYEGHGTSDQTAKIKLRVAKRDGDRNVLRVVANRLRFRAGRHHCETSGRTGRQAIDGAFRVQNDGDFVAVGHTSPPNPLAGGELKVRGEIAGGTATGTVSFTFGKTGCRTGRVEWVARR